MTQPQTGTPDAERLHLYPEVGDWVGWLELDETVTGFVDASGTIHRPSEPTADGGWSSTGSDVALSPRTGAWNLARAALKRAVETPVDAEGRTDYYHPSASVSVLQLAMKAMGWIGATTDQIEDTLEILANEAERIHALSVTVTVTEERIEINAWPDWLRPALIAGSSEGLIVDSAAGVVDAPVGAVIEHRDHMIMVLLPGAAGK